MIGEWQLILGAVVTVIGSVLAARYAGLSSVRVAQVSTTPEERRAATDEWRSIVDGLRSEVNALRDDQAEDRRRIDALSDQVETGRRRIQELEHHAASDARWRRSALHYISALRGALTTAGITVPRPPEQLHVDIDQ